MNKEEKTKLINYTIIAVVIYMFYYILFQPTPQDTEQAKIKQESDNKKLAFYTAHTFVERHLLAPATANFENYNDGCTTFTPPNTYKISSHVDSKNAFGVPLRMSYHATLQQTSPDNYTCKLLVIDNKIFIQ